MDEPVRVEVPDDEDGRRLDVALAAALGESRSQAAARIERGEVRDEGGVPLAKSHRVVAGEELVVVARPPEPSGAAGAAMPPVRYEDEHLLVVDKPAGLVVHPGAGNPAGTLVQVLQREGIPLAGAADPDRPGIVHRLDRDTSGLLVVAKTDDAYHGLVAALKRREVGRRYLALTQGRPGGEARPDSIRIDVPIGRDPSDRKRFAAHPEGKHAVTHVQHLAAGTADRHEVALVRCRLETGRTHQIRVHLAYAGTPVVGDAMYGAAPELATVLGLDRMFLHAAGLQFAHPITGRSVEVESPLPGDLADALDRTGIESQG